MEIERITPSEWDRALPDREFEVFHAPEALDVVDRHASGDLRLYAGYKGDRPVGLFPLVVRRQRIGKAVVSPPPGMGIPRLGPLVMPASPKRSKREQLNRDFVTEVLDRCEVEGTGSLLRVICPPAYADPRPFDWEGFDVEPAFTYALETEGESAEELLKSCSKSLRREIRDARDLDVEVTIEGRDAAQAVYEETRARYREQDREFSLEWPYVRDLTEAMLDADRCRVYVARDPGGRFLSGITVLYSNDAAYFWQGGTKATYEGVSVNSLLHWRIVEDLIEDPIRESVTRYDLMGANTERLCRYKSKFGAELTPYYVVESGGASMELAKKAYRFVER